MDPSIFAQPELRVADHLELLARQVVEGFIIGLHKSPYHGFSVEFAEHRLYNAGEATRFIDWKVYARSDKLFVKKYEEETNLRCQMVIDTSSSMRYPDKKESERLGIYNKLQFSVVAAAALMHLLKRQRDAFGLTLFSNTVDVHTQCRSTTTHQRLLYNHLVKAAADDAQKKTSAARALHEIAESIHQRSLVVVFSDMLDETLGADAQAEELLGALKHLRHNKHEVILFHTYDGDREMEFKFDNRPHRFVDLETGQQLKLNPAEVKKAYLERMHAYKKMLHERCVQYRIDVIEADIRKGFTQILMPYLLKRAKMS
ncbi:MAG TPA: DUF58 domain-containing protein [Chitinophagales bacterium]|nr:DUF58 domain-containing protein [Chitinophagales bacterium]